MQISSQISVYLRLHPSRTMVSNQAQEASALHPRGVQWDKTAAPYPPARTRHCEFLCDPPHSSSSSVISPRLMPEMRTDGSRPRSATSPLRRPAAQRRYSPDAYSQQTATASAQQFKQYHHPPNPASSGTSMCVSVAPYLWMDWPP